ncbi:hypothetical protein ACFX2F_014378 [Malus domestica]
MHTWISPLENPSLNVVPELNDWVYNGNKIRVTELQRIIHDLRKRKCFSQAFQISKWMNQKGICIFSPVEHVVQLDLIGKVEFCTNCCEIKPHVIAGKLKLGRNIGSGSFEELYLGVNVHSGEEVAVKLVCDRSSNRRFSSDVWFMAKLAISPPWLGKTAYCNGMSEYIQLIRRKVFVVHLDHAIDALQYPFQVQSRFGNFEMVDAGPVTPQQCWRVDDEELGNEEEMTKAEDQKVL